MWYCKFKLLYKVVLLFKSLVCNIQLRDTIVFVIEILSSTFIVHFFLITYLSILASLTLAVNADT